MADFAMDDDVVRGVLDPLTGQRPTGTTYSPSACAPVSMFDGAQPAPSLAGVAAGEGGGRSTFTEAVVARRPDVAAVAAYVRRCPIVVQNDGRSTLTTTYAIRDAAPTRADEVLVVDETPDGAASSQQRALLAYARVGEHAVWVRLRAFQGQPVDRAEFDRLVAAAVDKVARSA